MNFYELFEASKDKEEKSNKASKQGQDIEIRDPKAARALDVARTKYAYAETDLEAFVKMMQDEQDEDDKEIDELEKETAKQEQEINDLKQQDMLNSQEIDKLEKETDLQQKQLHALSAKEVAYEKTVASMAQVDQLYKKRIEILQQELETLEDRLRYVKGYKPFPATPKPELPDPEDIILPLKGEIS